MLSALIGNYTEQSLMYILIIEKIYWTATYMDIPPTMIND